MFRMIENYNISADYVQNLINSLNETIIVVSEDRKIKFVNQIACKFLGYKRKELIGIPVNKIIGNEEFIINTDFDSSQNIKNYFISKEGQKITAVISGKALQDRETVYFSNSFRDYQQEMKFEKTHFNEIFNDVHFAMVLINNNGEILFVNRIFTELFGYENNEAVGKQIYELVASKDIENEVRENIKQMLQGEKLFKEVMRRDRNGVLKELLFLGAPVIVNGQQLGANIVYRDISKEKQTKRELEKANRELKEGTAKLVHTEKMTALGELTSSIAHELNQPLNNMRIICQDILRDIAKDRLDIETIPASIQDVDGQIHRMSKIIDHMRIFTRRLDNGMNMEFMDINDSINNLFLLLGEQLKVRNVEVIKDLSIDLPKILGDIIALEQVFTNILINARHALEDSNEKEKKIEIRSYMYSEKEIAVSISNTGEKIPEKIKERIFEPFFTTKEPGKSTGLGLSISKKIIEEHKGWIELEEVNRYTKFIVILPVLREGRNNK